MKKIITFLSVVSMLLATSIPSFAAEPAQKYNDEVPELSEEKKDALNEWVAYNEQTKQYTIKAGAERVLDEDDYDLLDMYITATNKALEVVDFSTGEVSIVSPDEEGYGISLAYTEGVDKIEFHWWGATVYMSKTTILNIGVGVTIAGIFVPHAVIAKILSALGASTALVPGGIAFDYNYILAGISTLHPGLSLVFHATCNYRWQ